MTVVRQSWSQTPAIDLATSTDLLHAVASSAIAADRVIRMYPPAATVAMSRRESLMAGFDAATTAALRRGFRPEIRPTGGRAVAYDNSCTVFDFVTRESTMRGDPSTLFRNVSTAIAHALRAFGVDARVGPVAGEYCPGEFSVNARGVVKLVGTSQRAIRGARLLSGVVAFGAVGHLVDVLIDVNDALALEWTPQTFGSLAIESAVPDRAAIEQSLLDALRDVPALG